MLKKDFIEKVVGEVLEDTELEERFLTDLMYFVHRNDIEKTEADWLGRGKYLRDRNKLKMVEECEIHIGRCLTCRKRLRSILKKLDIQPSRG